MIYDFMMLTGWKIIDNHYIRLSCCLWVRDMLNMVRDMKKIHLEYVDKEKAWKVIGMESNISTLHSWSERTIRKYLSVRITTENPIIWNLIPGLFCLFVNHDLNQVQTSRTHCRTIFFSKCSMIGLRVMSKKGKQKIIQRENEHNLF